MAIPLIDNRTSLQTATVGQVFALQLAALGSPDAWEALHLPDGLTINETSGLITGTVDPEAVPGLYQVLVQAENEDGASQIVLLLRVKAATVPLGEWNDHELDFDLKSRLVTQTGIATPESGEVITVKRGDFRPYLIGLIKDAELQDLGETITLRLGLKENAGERLIELTDGTAERVGTGKLARYRIWLRMTPAKWRAILSDYEAEDETRFIARGEIQVQDGLISALYNMTRTIPGLLLYGGIGAGGSGGVDPLDETLRFTGLTAVAGASYTLTLALVVAGRSSQNVTLTRTLTLTYTGGAWVVSALTGDSTGQGANDGAQWRATLNNTAVAGDAGGVDVDVRITTTADASGLGPTIWVVDARNTGDLLADGTLYLAETRLRLLDSEGTEIGVSGTFGLTYLSPATLVAAYATAWEEADGGEVEIEIDGAGTLRITAPEGSDVATVIVEHPADEEDSDSYAGMANARAATLSGQLAQAEDLEALPTSISSRNFGVGIGDDIVPDL